MKSANKKSKKSALIPWFIYILKCKDDKLYTGITNNLKRRFQAHNSGNGGKFTRCRIPVTLVYNEEVQTRSDALKREAQIKSLAREKKIGLFKDIKKECSIPRGQKIAPFLKQDKLWPLGHSAKETRAKARAGSILMNSEIERDLGEQPMARIMIEEGLKPNDLVSVSTEQITHKMVSRAVKGRRLKPNIQQKILNALNKAAEKQYKLKDLFTY